MEEKNKVAIIKKDDISISTHSFDDLDDAMEEASCQADNIANEEDAIVAQVSENAFSICRRTKEDDGMEIVGLVVATDKGELDKIGELYQMSGDAVFAALAVMSSKKGISIVRSSDGKAESLRPKKNYLEVI